MKKRPILVAALLLGCSTSPPQYLPPPFGPDGPSPTRLFFPTGLSKTNEGGLLVANGNFNHSYDAGTVVGISRAFFDRVFGLRLDCGKEVPDPGCVQPFQETDFTGAVMIGNYAGPLVMNATGTAAYTGSRDTGTLNAVRVDALGLLHCAAGAGDDATKDCRKGLIDLVTAGVDGPYSIVAGDTVLPGTTTSLPVLFVSSIIPHIDAINSGSIFASTWVAALDMADPSQMLFTMRAGQTLDATLGTAVGPMTFDGVRRQLYLSGCYQRSSALGAGEPGTGLCVGSANNFLRIMNVDSKEAAADPRLIDLHVNVLSTYTLQLLLADPDPVTGAPGTLWATMRSPDALVRIDLPAEPSIDPHVRQVIPMPIAPADMVRIDRGSASALLAVVTERRNGVVIVDTATGEVVGVADRLGDSPFMMQEIPCPSDPLFTDSACLAVSVFGDCRIGLIEVPKSQPAQTKVRALAGSCPQ